MREQQCRRQPRLQVPGPEPVNGGGGGNGAQSAGMSAPRATVVAFIQCPERRVARGPAREGGGDDTSI